ncbi:glycosyltransferase family 2 protein [Lactobacillus helveticus]|uniref:glycosyltransferase family 2 protein n=1 Tax=Lactobacillus helveticus TaxID=1587 RepID=UPI0021825839|nr:glycosyltransferase family 2 protein [Lactobacillus helveticus]MCT0192287.1 glycosyltransferase family 2 protein [Lactobacillus helveticus]
MTQNIKPLVTVLTPTYNRMKTLKELYRSLCNQTCFNFQWLVIDDESTDATRDFFKKCETKTLPFILDYVYKKNGGKHTALNFSHKFIKGEYLIIVDSDDFLVKDAIEQIILYWRKYSNLDIGAIIFQRGHRDGVKFDNKINKNIVTTFAEAMNSGIKGDHCETVKSELFKNFQFPVFDGENFIAEGAMWYSVTKGKKVVYIDKVIYIAEYLSGGLTKSGRKLQISNARGAKWHASMFLSDDFSLKVKLKNALLYGCYCNFLKENLFIALRKISNKKIVVLAWLPSKVLYTYWNNKYGK